MMTFEKFDELISRAIAETDARLAEAPNYGVYRYASEELKKIKSLIQKGKIPTVETNLGLMAARELDHDEPDYADILHQISYQVQQK